MHCDHLDPCIPPSFIPLPLYLSPLLPSSLSPLPQVSLLHNKGCEVVVVTSGAVAFGKLRMKQEAMLSKSVRHTILGGSRDQAAGAVEGFSGGDGGGMASGEEGVEPRACAAAGQAGLMALYETMFAQYGVSCAQASALGGS